MREFLLSAPVTAKVLGALFVIVLANRFCRHLLVSVAIGALTLALWSGHSAAAMSQIAWNGLSDVSNLLLVVAVTQVIWLSSQMSATGVMEELVSTMRRLVSRRAAMAALPAVIGLLPMPGGALFSAPLVDSLDTDGGVSPQLKAQTNHWFRHVWEYWWPLYPGVLLAMKLTGLEVWQFMLLGVPLSVLAVGAGYVFLLRRIGAEGRTSEGAQQGASRRSDALRSFLHLVFPIALVIASYAAVRLLYGGLRHLAPNAPPMNRFVPMIVGLCAAMLALQWQRPLGWAGWRRILLSRRVLDMAAIVVAVLVYGEFTKARLPGGQLLVAQMHAEMAAWGIPIAAVIMLLPLISGLSMGLSYGFVGASFPIVMSLLGPNPPLRAVLSTTVLAYGFGYIGMLLSPVHVCLIVTSEHFRTGVLRNAAGLLRPAAVMLAATVAMHVALR